MTKDAVKKYTKQLGIGGMILHYTFDSRKRKMR